MPVFLGELEGGVNSERRHLQVNRFSWGSNASNFTWNLGGLGRNMRWPLHFLKDRAKQKPQDN